MRTGLSLLAALLFATAAAGGTISGTVTQFEPPSALSAMSVAAYDAAGVLRATAVSDAQGRYSLTVSDGTYRVLAYDPAGVYATSFYDDAESFDTSRPLALQGAQSITAINFALKRGGFIDGTVTAALSPRPNITVAAYNLSGTLRGFTKSDANGAYHLVLPAGTYKLAAYDDARVYATSFYSGSASFGGATPLAVTAAAATTADFHLAAGARIRGRVSDSASGASLAGIVVTAYDGSGNAVIAAASTASGTYELFVPAGSYRLVFEDRAGTYASTYFPDAESFDTAAFVAVAAGASTGNVDAALKRGGRITGNVRDADSGTPLASIIVAAYNPSGTVRTFTATDASGRYTLIVPPGAYKVGAYDANVVYAPQFRSGQPAFAYGSTIAVAAGDTAGSVDFNLRRGVRLSGRVTDRGDGSPISGVTVAVYDLAGNRITSARSAADGTYRLVVAPGVYKVAAFDETLHYANAYLDDAVSLDASRAVAVSGDAELTGMSFSMPAGATVRGNVVDFTYGAPLGGIVVSAYDDSTATAIASAITDASGNVAFAVPPGTYRFVAADPQHRFATSYFDNVPAFDQARQVTLIAGGSATVSFRLAAPSVPPRRRAVRR